MVDFYNNHKAISRLIRDRNYSSFNKVKIVYVRHNNNLTLFEDDVKEGIMVLQSLLIKAIANNLQAPDLSKQMSIGLLWNEYCNKLSNEDKISNDITDPFHLWSTSSEIEIDTWIYNIDKKIIFEISPTYRWHFDEPKGKNYITYEQFISKYVPIDILEIDNNTAREWLDLSMNILSDD